MSGNKVTDLGPLDWRVSIVDQTGKPSPEFQRRWNTQRNNNSLIPADFIDLQDVPHTYMSAGGYLVRVKSTVDGLEFASTSTVLDAIDANQGAILFRGATGWQGLDPSTPGFVLTTEGPGANPEWAAQQGDSGFGFFCQGLLGANQLVGTAIYGFEITFDDTDTDNIFVSVIPATSTAVFTLVAPDIHGLPSVVGTITFAAGSAVGVLAWTTNPYILLAATRLELFTPAIADITLSDVSGLCFGVKS